MLSTKRSASDMMVCSPQRFPLLMDNRLGQGSVENAFEANKRRKLSLKEKIYNNSKLEAQNRSDAAMLRARLKRRSNVLGLRDENGASGSSDGGSRVHGGATTFKKVRHENSKDTIKFSQRHLDILENQYQCKLNEVHSVVNKQEVALKEKSKQVEDLKAENNILKRGVLIQETKNKHLSVETNSYKTIIAQMKDYIMKLEQRNYSLHTQLSQRDGMEPFHTNHGPNFAHQNNHGF